MSDGVAQHQRLPRAWADGGFQVDEMSLDRRIEVCARLAEELRFIDHHGHEDGHWGRWFSADETFVLARIASVDRFALQQAFLKEYDSARPERLARRIFVLVRWIDSWLQALSGAERVPVAQGQPPGAPTPAVAVRELIRQLIKPQLGGRLVWMHAQDALKADLEALPGGRGELHPLWFESPAEPSIERGGPLRVALRGIFFSFITAIGELRALARARLPESLATGHHEPSAGLLLAFMKVYEQVQQEINRFTDQHIDFYYHRVLGLQARPAQPDRAHVVCLPDPLAPPERVLPAGTLFVAGRDIAGQDLHFRSETPFAFGGARVAELCSLRLQRDPRKSPEADLGYVTGVRAQRLGARDDDAPTVPLFGGGPGSEEAALGLAIASPVLRLQPGRREIELRLRLGWPGASQNELLAAALAAEGPQFRAALGALFACWMLSDHDSLTEVQRSQLRACAQRAGLDVDDASPASGLGSPLQLMCGRPPVASGVGAGEYRPRDLAFFHYLNELFEVQLTHEQGWFTAERIQIGRPPPSRGGGASGGASGGSNGAASGGLQLTILLRPEDPAIVDCDPRVHGAQWPTRLPLLRLLPHPHARIHPYSLFERTRLFEAELHVTAHDLRDLLLQNNQGPLDGQKAFSPFGPLPNASSYLVLGSAEAAGKNLSSLRLHLQWGGLPAEPGGFATHYAGHAPELAAGRFTAALSLLRDGQWRPCGGPSADQPLFAAPDARGRLVAEQTITVHAESVRQFARASEQPLAFGTGVRDGLLRLSLKEPRGAFGHEAWPALLSSTLTAQARRRRPLPMPKAPYTPVLERISLDYTASAHIAPASERAVEGGADAERLLHIHPFGVAELQPDGQLRYHGLLPRLEPDGNLCIGLQAEQLEGPLSLLFQLRPDKAARHGGDDPRAPLSWSYLQGNLWRPLATRHLLSDSTQGMIRSGIVQLDLPPGPRRDNTALPGGLFWLRVSRAGDLDGAPPLRAVHAQALTLVRESGAAGAADAPLPAGRIVQPVLPQAGLAALRQPEPSFGWQPAEDPKHLRVRAGERLRHKNRGSLAWDIERLVLEAFPEVFKVLCLPPPAAGLGRGEVRVVVVPHVRVQSTVDATRAHRLDPDTLQRIGRLLATRHSLFAQMRVCNPDFERVLVRCRVQLERGVQPGAVLRQVHRRLVEYLSPWHPDGLGARFGWLLRCDEVQAIVRGVPGVDTVGQLSLLSLDERRAGHHVLTDTARLPRPAALADADPRPTRGGATLGSDHSRLLHARPWSLVLPMAEHLIKVVPDLEKDEAEPTGLADLAAGSQLVVTGGAR